MMTPYPVVDHDDGSPAGAIPAADVLAVIHPEIVAMARAVCLATLPAGWTMQLYRGSHLTITAPGPDRVSYYVGPSITQRALWRASIIGDPQAEETLHHTIQQAIDAIVARHQALTIGDVEGAA